MNTTTANNSSEVIIIHCQFCSTGNAVRRSNADRIVKCGKCKNEIFLEPNIKKEIHKNKLDKVKSSFKKLEEIFDDGTLIELFKEYLDNSELTEYYKSLSRIEDKIETLETNQKPLTLVVTGEFSAGKSYVINSLIGEELLPVGSEPVTMAPSSFSYGEETEIIIEFNDGEIKNISTEEFKNIKHTNKDNLPKEYEDIKCIHFKYPYPKLAKINIIDTPGFNTSTAKGDDEKTMQIILEKAEVILWVFNANTGTSGESEKAILSKLIDSFKKKNSNEFIGEGLGHLKGLNIPIIGLVNQIDMQGKPNSDKVKKVIEKFKEDSKIDTIIPYSAKKILESKSKNINKTITQVLTEKLSINNGFSLNIESIVDDFGKKAFKIIQGNEILFKENIADYTDWDYLLINLEENLENIKSKSQSILLNSIENEIEEIKRETKRKLNVIKVSHEYEIKKYIFSIDQTVKVFEKLKSNFSKDYNNYEESFKRNFMSYFTNKFFSVTLETGFFSNCKRINFNSDIATNDVYLVLFKCLEFDSILSEEIEIIESSLKKLKDIFNKNEFLNSLIELISSSSSLTMNNLDYMIQSSFNIVANNSISTAEFIYNTDRFVEINESLSDYNILKDYNERLFDITDATTLFHWLKTAKVELCDYVISKLNLTKEFVSEDKEISEILLKKESLLS